MCMWWSSDLIAVGVISCASTFALACVCNLRTFNAIIVFRLFLKGKIENILMPFIDSSNDKLQRMAAECYSLLPQCGGGGNRGLKHAEFWSKSFERILSGLHDTLDLLYDSFETGLCAEL